MTFATAIFGVTLGLLFLMPASRALAATPRNGDYVVLLHGMGRTSLSMKRLEWYFSQRGYRVINATYRSRSLSVEQLADIYLRKLLSQNITDFHCKVHFVAHSLGGIILRQYLTNHKIDNLGRVVMLAPPNHGSEIIDFLLSNCLSRNFLGAAAKELGTDGLPTRLGPVTFYCGVIAGDRSGNPILSSLLPGPNDGKVTVESARVPGMRDFQVLHGTHTWLMWKPAVLKQTLCFVQSGRFDPSN